MNRIRKITIIYGTMLVLGGIIAVSYHNDQLNDNTIFGQITIGFAQIKLVDVEQEKLFGVMADIEKYPKILPNNILSVQILNKTTRDFATETLVKNEVFESGIKTELILKHTTVPNNLHIIEVVEGDAKGTKITLRFEPKGNSTLLSTDTEIRVKGILAPFGLLVQSNLESALNTIIEQFIEYAKNQN